MVTVFENPQFSNGVVTMSGVIPTYSIKRFRFKGIIKMRLFRGWRSTGF